MYFQRTAGGAGPLAQRATPSGVPKNPCPLSRGRRGGAEKAGVAVAETMKPEMWQSGNSRCEQSETSSGPEHHTVSSPDPRKAREERKRERKRERAKEKERQMR